MRKVSAVILLLLLLTNTALADVYTGKTVAGKTETIEAAAGGTLGELNAMVGCMLCEGDIIGSVRTTRVFAAQDGTVARISVQQGGEANGTVLEINPMEKYRIYCTVDEAYSSPETTLIHSGEQLYIKCTKDGTHRGVGLVTEIDGSEFTALAIGGEMYIGETVYLYRDAGFSREQRVGIGTVTANDTVAYESEGTIVQMHVAEGEFVERGELLYELAQAEETDILSPVSGIVTDLSAEQGDSIKKGQALLTVAAQEEICVEISVNEDAVSKVAPGDAVQLIYAANPEETPAAGTISEISYIASNETYAVRIRPENTEGLRLGMTVSVRIGSE